LGAQNYNAIISGNYITYNNQCGILQEFTANDNTIILKNEIKYNGWHGISILDGSVSYISDNNITNNGQAGTYDGIYLTCDGVNIIGNRIINNTNDGIEFFESSDNQIIGNIINFSAQYE